jgi:lactate permease
MSTALALLPLLLVLVLLASGRAGALWAGVAGLCATVVVSGAPRAMLAREIPAGLWLSWTVIAIIVAGLFFHRCTLARVSPTASVVTEATPRRLWAVCFLLAPFSEAVTGFGVGYIIALAALRRLGLGGITALLFGLYSQSLVPWGALATGTTVGATLAGLTPNQLGLASAVLQAPIHVFYLLLYWRFARQAGIKVPLPQKIDDALWTTVLLALVWLVNRYADAAIAAAAPTAVLLALRFWRGDWQKHGRPDLDHLRQAIVANAPYVALTAALCATRLVPPLRDFLMLLWAIRPYDDQPAFAPLYAPGFWLVSIGIVVVLAARGSLLAVTRDTLKSAWRSCAVTLAFVVMAELYVGSGMARQIAEALHQAAGRGAALGVPLFAAVGGFLTGGGSAGNAMLMPMVMALGRAIALDPAWVAAVQNSVCTNLTMLSPIRVTMGLAILALAIPDSALYRRAWPLALPPLITGVAAIGLLLYAPAS